MQIARSAGGVVDVVDQLTIAEATATTGIDRSDELGDDVERGAEKSKNVLERGVDATVDGAKKVGTTVRDAVTDEDRDSDNDGK